VAWFDGGGRSRRPRPVHHCDPPHATQASPPIRFPTSALTSMKPLPRRHHKQPTRESGRGVIDGVGRKRPLLIHTNRSGESSVSVTPMARTLPQRSSQHCFTHVKQEACIGLTLAVNLGVGRGASLTSIGFLDNARKEQIASFDGTKLPQNAVILPLLPFIHAFLTIF
jgi:hypothetical protein